MPSAFRNPKNLAEWLRLDYFRYPRQLPRLRRLLCWATFLVCIVLLCATAFHRSEATLYQAGPLSPGHASFNNDCGKCHQASFATAQRFLPWQQAASSVPDAACLNCHKDQPLHNEKLLPEAKKASCASCHQEHRGLASLERLPDITCLKCHRDVKANSQNGGQCTVKNVTGFPEVHPDFRGLETDPGKINFNHWVHVNLDEDGVPLVDERHKEGKRALTCTDCHQTDSAGRYMRPILYATNCQKCHPLSVQLGGDYGKKLDSAVAAFAQEAAPHTTPDIVRAVLRERLLRFVNDHPLQPVDAAADALVGLPRPKANPDGSSTNGSWTAAPGMADADKLAFVQGQLSLSQQMLFDRGGGCRLCHVETQPYSPEKGLPEYALSNIPNRWFSESKFDHRIHRMIDCKDCHAVTDKSVRSSDVLMPRLQKCAECHSAKGGARNDCIECHLYHPRDHGKDAQRPGTLAEGVGK